CLSSVGDYLIGGQLVQADDSHRRRWLAASLVLNLGILGFFKYFNFFVDSAARLLSSLHLQPNLPTLSLVLPVGISFYTFQTLSYTIDLYYRRCEPAESLLEFCTFVAFFPQLVAGPIERARHLLGQFRQPRTFDYAGAAEGFRLMLWGFFKKLVVADNCAVVVDQVFGDPTLQGGPLVLGVVLFAFQIYADFSGYSDIAIGTARLFSIDICTNFNNPYFARDLHEFWQRWHISLSTWFRDYVYIPLGGNRQAKRRNLLLTFLVSGLWHGANWTFLAWGLLHGLAYLVWPSRDSQRPIGWRDLPAIGATFSFVTLAWVFFRAQSLAQALGYLARATLAGGHFAPIWSETLNCALIGVTILLVCEWLTRHRSYPLEGLAKCHFTLRWLVYLVLINFTYLIGNLGSSYDFIYFQF
ncbi:MAG: MBOAT family protein, partial [Candidatus Eremiobacteraeota bacterium]|nr:MBOAT family protein [Candidatus Eremiobacteraeota bacterium]